MKSCYSFTVEFDSPLCSKAAESLANSPEISRTLNLIHPPSIIITIEVVLFARLCVLCVYRGDVNARKPASNAISGT